MTQTSPWLAAALFVALVATAVALGPALAHLFELPNKMRLGADAYFTTQQIYAGWSLLAIVLAVQFVAMIATAILGRSDPPILAATIVAITALIAAQVVFWVWTYPANVATDQWTRMPENLEAVRNDWEYSHAAGAAFQLIAMVSLSYAAVSTLWRGSAG